jgi:hypothetical protein
MGNIFTAQLNINLELGVTTRPVQSFETQYLNTNHFTFRSLFGHKLGLDIRGVYFSKVRILFPSHY